MTVEELQEKRNQLVGEIRQHAEKFEQNGKEWPTKADKQKWDKVNADYDKVVAELEEAGEVNGRLNQINGDGDSAPGVSIGRDDAQVGWQGGRQTIGGNGRSMNRQAVAPEFVDASTGRPIPTLKAGQRYQDAFPAPTEFAGGPVPRIGEVIASKLMGQPVGGMTERQYMASLTGVDADGGFATVPSLFPRIVDLLRAQSVVFQGGAQQMFVDSAETRIIRLTEDVSANWRAEGQVIPHSAASFGAYTLRMRSVAAIATVTIELSERARNLVAMIERSMGAAIGQAIDRAVLYGSGAGEEPTGILNDDDIHEVDSVGTPTGYGHVSDAVGQILQSNFAGSVSDLSWVQHPRDAVVLDKLTDGDGQPLAPTPWASQVQRLHTTSLPTDGGGSENESQALVGHFPSILVGQLGNIRFQTFDTGTYTDNDGNQVSLMSTYQRALRMVVHMDAVTLQPSLFTKLTGITTA